jgi:hypothetical protein
MINRPLRLAIALCAGVPALAAQTPAFTMQREITVDSSGWHRLDLDATLLAAGKPFRVIQNVGEAGAYTAVEGLGDLRLYSQSSREVPYLLVYPPPHASMQLVAGALAITPTKYASGFEIDLKSARLVDQLQVSGLPAPFIKRVRLDGSGDRAHWTQLVAEGTLFDLPADRMRSLTLDFPPGEYRYLRVTWDDRSSGRMPIPSQIFVRFASTRAPATAPLTIPLGVEKRASEPGMSRYALKIPAAHLPIVAIRIVVQDSNVLRSASVTEARLNGTDLYPRPLGSTTLRRTVRGGAVASALDIPIEAPQEDRIELAVDDGNNPPLGIVQVSAVLAQLPYIVFGTEDARAVTAKFGDPALDAPVYDLEALRDSAASFASTPAKWGDVTRLVPVADARPGSVVPMVGAPIDADRFRWSRAINDSVPGLATLPLDVAVLAHSRLVDLRIVDAQDRQVPYLFEHLSGPLDDTLPALEPMKVAEHAPGAPVISRYRVHLPFDSLSGARLVLRTSARVFQRRVHIEIPLNENQRRGPGAAIAESPAEWAHAMQETPAQPLSLNLPRTGKDDIMLVIEEGDNSPLPLDAPNLLLPGYQLRFQSDGTGGLRLMYGRQDIATPRYDIALLAPRLVGVPATEVSMASEGNALTPPTNAIPVRVFWGALIAAVLVLLVIVARLVRAEPAPATEAAK